MFQHFLTHKGMETKFEKKKKKTHLFGMKFVKINDQLDIFDQFQDGKISI